MALDEKILIFNIQKYSLHDGEGIRTVVFLKGCPLRCRWCCNPESQNAKTELIFRKTRCIGNEKCGLCKEASLEDIISFDETGIASVDFSKLNDDFEWINVCPTGALEMEGKYIDIEEVVKIVEQDAVFYNHGNGGLTLSGGEPLMQKQSIELLKRVKQLRINTAIETSGCVQTERILDAAPYTDKFFFDIKSLNDRKHKEYTGYDGSLIRNNLKELYKNFKTKKIVVRTPVIPGFNDLPEELEMINEFLKDFPGVTWEKLPYHKYGVGKYEMLGRQYLL